MPYLAYHSHELNKVTHKGTFSSQWAEVETAAEGQQGGVGVINPDITGLSLRSYTDRSFSAQLAYLVFHIWARL